MLFAGPGAGEPTGRVQRSSVPRGRGLVSQPAGSVIVTVSVRERVLGVRPCGLWVSGRVASGLSPYGVASFVHAGWGRITRSRRTSRPHLFPCPNGALWWLAPVGTQDLPWVLLSLGASRATSHGGRAVAIAIVRSHGFSCYGARGLRPGLEAVPVLTPGPTPSVLDEDAAGAVKY